MRINARECHPTHNLRDPARLESCYSIHTRDHGWARFESTSKPQLKSHSHFQSRLYLHGHLNLVRTQGKQRCKFARDLEHELERKCRNFGLNLRGSTQWNWMDRLQLAQWIACHYIRARTSSGAEPSLHRVSNWHCHWSKVARRCSQFASDAKQTFACLACDFAFDRSIDLIWFKIDDFKQ